MKKTLGCEERVLELERAEERAEFRPGEKPPLYPGHRILAMFPFYNEASKIEHMAGRLREGLVDRIIGVNDGSSDDGPRILRERGIEVMDCPHKGAGSSIRAAINYGRINGFDILVVMAGNNKDNPEEIPRLLEPILEGKADYVQGSRFMEGGSSKHLPVFRLLAIRFLSALFSLYSGNNCTDLTNGFRSYRLSLFDDPRIDIWQEWLSTYELEYYVHLKVFQCGYRMCEVPVSKVYPPTRCRSYSKIKPILGWWRMLRPFVYVLLRVKK
jgi:dolichol-phosphate mannosyltransferase